MDTNILKPVIVCYTGGTAGDIISKIVDPGEMSLDRQRLKKPHLFSCDEEKDLQALSTQEGQSNLSLAKQEFLDQLDELKTFIFNRIKPINLNIPAAAQVSLKASDYLVMARAYVNALNNGAVPTITDAWTEIVEGQARNIIAKATKNYQKEIKAYIQQNSGD